MAEMTYTPGTRQTVDRAKHPTLGEGTAVYNNGPAYFKADSGEVIQCRSISWGGWSAGPPQRSFLLAVTETGTRIELDDLGMGHGDRHERAWHSIHGAGWLVSVLSRKVDKAMVLRFEPDDGKPFEFTATGWARGRPTTAMQSFKRMASGKSSSKAEKRDPEDNHWITYRLPTGEFIAFSDAPPPDAAPVAVEPNPTAQMDLFAAAAP